MIYHSSNDILTINYMPYNIISFYIILCYIDYVPHPFADGGQGFQGHGLSQYYYYCYYPEIIIIIIVIIIIATVGFIIIAVIIILLLLLLVSL